MSTDASPFAPNQFICAAGGADRVLQIDGSVLEFSNPTDRCSDWSPERPAVATQRSRSKCPCVHLLIEGGACYHLGRQNVTP